MALLRRAEESELVTVPAEKPRVPVVARTSTRVLPCLARILGVWNPGCCPTEGQRRVRESLERSPRD
jgi:hypothetical protein